MKKANLTLCDTGATSVQKLEDAHKMIAEFFQSTDLEYMRVELWQFLRAVTTEKPFSFLGDPSTVLCLKKHLYKITTACRLLLDVAEESDEHFSMGGFHPFSDDQIAADKRYMRELKELNSLHGGMVRRLTLAETERPILAIKRAFDVYSYEQWQEILEDWVEYGLSKASICEATGECAEIIQYELLESLLEAIYLISRQNEEIPYQKRRLSKVAGNNEIIELLIAVLEPELIFAVTHSLTSTTDQICGDLLIVLPDINHRPSMKLESVIELITTGDKKLCCSFMKLSELYHTIHNGHLYFSLACTEENLIYRGKGVPLPKISPENLTGLIEKSRQDFAAGLAKAKKFFDGASYYQETKEYPLCIFMMHQVTETIFRAIAIALYGSEKRTHSIRTLKRFNLRLAPQLNDVFPGDSPDEERLLQLLEDAYLGSRYDTQYEVEQADIDRIFPRVVRLIEISQATIDERLARLRQTYHELNMTGQEANK